MTHTEQATTEPTTTTTTSFGYIVQTQTERFGVTDWYDASHQYDTAERARNRIDGGEFGDFPTRIVKRTTIVVVVEEIV